MKTVEIKRTTTYLNELPDRTPIFLQKDGKIVGMIVNEESKGWIGRTGGQYGVAGHHNTREACVESCISYGFKPVIED